MELKQLKDFDVKLLGGISGSKYPSPNEFKPQGSNLFITTQNFKEFGLDFNGNYISNERYQKLGKVNNLMENDLLISVIGTLGQIIYLENIPQNLNIVANASVTGIRVLDERINKKYLYQLLKSNFLLNQMLGKGQGSIQKYITNSVIENLKIPYYPIDEQKKIGDFLYNIDLLRRKNVDTIKKIEDYLSNLYTYWFLQFEFPNEKGQPYKSSGGEMVYNETLGYEIPKDWEDGTLGDIAEILHGYNYKKDEYVDNGEFGVIKVSSLKDGKININHNVNRNLKVKKSQFSNVGETLLTVDANIGGYILNYIQNVAINSGVCRIIQKNNYPIYALFLTDNITNYAKNLAYGSIIKHISPKTIEKYKLTLPNADILEKFNKETEGYLDLIVKLRQQNDQLEQMKDYYSELLFNGQIKIK